MNKKKLVYQIPNSVVIKLAKHDLVMSMDMESDNFIIQLQLCIYYIYLVFCFDPNKKKTRKLFEIPVPSAFFFSFQTHSTVLIESIIFISVCLRQHDDVNVTVITYKNLPNPTTTTTPSSEAASISIAILLIWHCR